MNEPACTAILPFVKPHHVGVEIGVFAGDSSVLFLERAAFMYFIDPCYLYHGISDKEYVASEACFLKRTAPYAKSLLLKGLSHVVWPDVPPVDFVFIDGNHRYDYVFVDIFLYWERVRSGGFLSGHDFNQEGVSQAVHNFAACRELEVFLFDDCWLLKKP